jgi:hypothetical protein
MTHLKKEYYIIVLITLLGCSHPNPKNRILVVIRGDSYCDGIGSSGTTSSSTYYAGKQIQGPQTWEKQLQRRLNQNTSGKIFIVSMEGYPGETAKWFVNGDDGNTHFKDAKDYISDNITAYSMIIFSSPFGINESGNMGAKKEFSTDTLISNINKISKDVLSIDDKIKIIGYPVPRRVDKFSKPYTNDFRNAYNSQILKNPQAIGSASVINYANYPEIYSNNAPFTKYYNQHDVDGLMGVHPSDLGYKILAEMYAEEIARISSSKLKPGN